MEYFPEESVRKAREIAQLYKDRFTKKGEILAALYDHKFIDAPYGFEDCIKQGRGGHYLHQLKKDADCFSLAGMDYIVARELDDLKPELYWATDMKDVSIGKDPTDSMTANHAFITVAYMGKRYILDRSMSLFGEIKFEEGKAIIKENREGLPQFTERLFSTLTNWSEKDYVEEMEKHQSAEGAKLALSSGQIVDIGGDRVIVQYFPTTNSLSASAFFECISPILEDTVTKCRAYALTSKISEDGNWQIDDGTLSFYSHMGRGWTREQCTLIHNEFKMPYRTAAAYVENLQKANSNSGVKSPIHKLSIFSPTRYFEEKGFSLTGDVTNDNGVDPEGHKKLLEEIVSAAPIHSEPKEAQPDIDRKAAFFSAQQKARSESNPFGMIYGNDQHDEFIVEMINNMQQDYSDKQDLMMDLILAKGGLQKGVSRLEKELAYKFNETTPIDHFRQALMRRKRNVPHFDESVDFALYQMEHPLGSVKVSEEELVEYYKAISHSAMVDLAWVLPNLKLKPFQAGLKKILAK